MRAHVWHARDAAAPKAAALAAAADHAGLATLMGSGGHALAGVVDAPLQSGWSPAAAFAHKRARDGGLPGSGRQIRSGDVIVVRRLPQEPGTAYAIGPEGLQRTGFATAEPAFDGTPRNRPQRSSGLGVPGIEVEHAHGRLASDRNGQAMALAADPASILGLAPCAGALSAISGRPAVRYRTDRLETCLTPREYARMVALGLRPHEVATLVRLYGLEHEWHEDSYDPEGGWAALQPKEGLLP